MRAIPTAAAALLLTVVSGASAAPTALPRSLSDRPDDRSGPQVHALYVLPSDGSDRSLDTDGTIAASVANFQAWLREQTPGRWLRTDTFQGELDVSFVRLPQTDAELAARGVYLRDAIEDGVEAAGFASPSKVYAVFYDGSNGVACGGGAWPPTLPGTVAAVYTRATYGEGRLCYEPERSRTGLQIMDYAILHELLHTLGFVPACAPSHTRSGHVSDDPNDLMYAGEAAWTPSRLDSGRNDYYGAGVGGCDDLSRSSFLEDAAAPQPPPPPPTQPPPPPPPPPAPVRQCVVPNLAGRTVPAARVALARSRCSLGRVTRVRARARRGRVVWQSARPGSRLAAGHRVAIRVSRGPRP